MTFILLLAIALCSGLLVALAFGRLAPAGGATAAAAEAVGQAAAEHAPRSWWQRRVDPATIKGLALSAAVALLIAGGFVVALLAFLVRRHAGLRSIDSGAAAWGNDHATHLSTRLLTWVTDFGDVPLLAIIGVAIVLYELRRAPNRWIVPFVLTVVLGDQLITTGIKDLVERARPTLNPIAKTLGPSFPSGHSSTAAAFYAALALIMARGRGRQARALLAGAAAGIAVAVAASRVLLDVHWVSDVVAGVMLGWAWFALCAIAFAGRHMRFPAEKNASTSPNAGPVRHRAPPAAEV